MPKASSYCGAHYTATAGLVGLAFHRRLVEGGGLAGPRAPCQRKRGQLSRPTRDAVVLPAATSELAAPVCVESAA